jgi:hypothetical protein
MAREIKQMKPDGIYKTGMASGMRILRLAQAAVRRNLNVVVTTIEF